MSERKITEQRLRDKLEYYQTRVEAGYVGEKLRTIYLAKIDMLYELISEL